jgi:DNA-binding transcriptional LysR family regulator
MLHNDPEKTRRPSLRELEALHALVEGRKTTAAASMLGISQPAISRAIRDLELRLGRTLFRRESGRLVATADGLQLYHDSRFIFQSLDRLAQKTDVDMKHDTLRIIAPPTLAHRFLPQILAAFRQVEPLINLQIEIGVTADVVAKVADGNYDLGMTDAQLHHPSVIFEGFRKATAHVFMRADDPLTGKTEVTPHDLHKRPFIGLSRRFSARSAMETVFRECGIEPRIMIESATSELAYELVKAGVGLAILNPFPLVFREDHAITIRRFAPYITFESSFVLSTAAPASNAARRFIDFVRHHQTEDGYSTPIR